MAPKTVLQRIGVALLCVVVVQLLVWRFYPSTPNTTVPASLLLKVPTFIGVAKAEDTAITATIGDEAGISAWYQAPSPINLALIRSQYRTIERETSDYILGSIPLAGYGEAEDIHLYVHKDGWLLAYYLAAEPAGKIFDWKAYESSNGATITTKLENTIAVILSALGIAFTEANYYDFRYPSATHMMIIAENNQNIDENFTINFPSTFIYYQRSWFVGGSCSIYLNGNKLGDDFGKDNNQGTILDTQLPANTSHTIRVSGGYGGLVLIYREQ